VIQKQGADGILPIVTVLTVNSRFLEQYRVIWIELDRPKSSVEIHRFNLRALFA
jgi:hypothetical protein